MSGDQEPRLGRSGLLSTTVIGSYWGLRIAETARVAQFAFFIETLQNTQYAP